MEGRSEEEIKIERRTGYAILEYLNSIKNTENGENIEVACQCLSTALNLDVSSPGTFIENSFFPVKISELIDAGAKATGTVTYESALETASRDPKFQIFADTCSKKGYFSGVEVGSLEYLQRNAKLIKKFREKTSGAVPVVAVPSKIDAEKAAEDKKAAGNEAIKNKDYELAVQLYSEALQFSANGPNSHIYHANRSAAYCHLEDYKRAASDCEASIRKCPTYTKAYSRLGLAQFFLGNYAAAATAYEKAVELEPGNKAHKDGLAQARQKLQEQEAIATAPAAPAPGFGGIPDLSSLLGGAGGGGGMMAMAQQMMQNPEMMRQAQQMMQNPEMMRQAMGALGGGGDRLPDFSQLAGMMNNFDAGGGGIPDFSGYQNN